MRIDIIMDIEYGSDFQKEFITNVFEPILEGTKIFYEIKHKKNKLNYTIVKDNKTLN